jgi:hypothetical protein
VQEKFYSGRRGIQFGRKMNGARHFTFHPSWFILSFLVVNSEPDSADRVRPRGLLSVTPAFAEQVAQLVDASGSVALKILQLAPKTLSKGKWVENGVIVTTGDASKALVKFLDGQVIALQSNSVFQVNDYNFDPADPSNGRINFVLRELQAINLNVTVGGSAAGASSAPADDGTLLGIPSGMAITIGVGAAAIAIGAGGGKSTTQH